MSSSPSGGPTPGESAGAPSWALAHGRRLDLSCARIVAILNCTPDSFSDGGAIASAADAVEAGRRALAEGAAMLDVGGESTQPGASAVSAAEQIARVVPAIRALRDAGVACPISVDTTIASVASAALDAGADAVNDQSAGRDDEGMFALVASRGAGVVLMHRARRPAEDRWSHETPGGGPAWGESGAVAAVVEFLRARAAAALAAGVARGAIVVDPGLGFGKSVEENFALIAATREIAGLGFPVMGAASRKSFVGRASGVAAPARRAAGSAAASVAQRLGGAAIFRVHDVALQREALAVADAVVAARAGPPRGP